MTTLNSFRGYEDGLIPLKTLFVITVLSTAILAEREGYRMLPVKTRVLPHMRFAQG